MRIALILRIGLGYRWAAGFLDERGVTVGQGDSNSEASVLKVKGLPAAAILATVLLGATILPGKQSGPQYPPQAQKEHWDPGGPDGRGWTERGKQEMLERLGKTLSWRQNAPDPGPEGNFLQARAGELLERTKQARGNNFQFDRLARAVDALLNASERVYFARKASQIDDNDKRDAAEFLQRCYFHVQQAEYFAGLSGEKEAKQYVTYTRSLYQQARSAYDAHQYDRAQMLGDASSLIVAALENIAHASLRIPDPPVIK